MNFSEWMLPVFGAVAISVRFVFDVAAVLVALYIWDRWIKPQTRKLT